MTAPLQRTSTPGVVTPPRLPRQGYFLAQEAAAVSMNWPLRRQSPYFSHWVTEDATKRFFEFIAGKVDGVDWVDYWVDVADAEESCRVAAVARANGVDLWAGIRWFKQFRVVPAVPAELAACQIDDAGRFVYAMFEGRTHLPDVLNPATADWMMDILEERYWPRMGGLVNGYFFPETSLGSAEIWGGYSVQPWKQAVYSPYVLDRWREYCAQHDVRWNGSQIDRFIVPHPHLAGAHPDRILFVPDERPEKVPSFTRYADIPRGTVPWLAWEDFCCELFHRNYLGRISARLNRYHAARSDWRGCCHFAQDLALLDYRNFRTREARTCWNWKYFPQGRRMGIDTRRLFQDANLTCFIAETIASPRDYWFYEENALSHGMAFAREHGRDDSYGFMLHYDHTWNGNIPDDFNNIMDPIEEDLRWEMFHRHRPPVFSYYSIARDLVPGGAWYAHNAEQVTRFWKRVEEYKRTSASRKED